MINNLGARPSLLKNFGPQKNWLLVRLRASSAIATRWGARVYVYAGGRRGSAARCRAGPSYLSQNDSRLHFGLGDDARYDRIEVHGRAAGASNFGRGTANRIVSLEAGQAVAPMPH